MSVGRASTKSDGERENQAGCEAPLDPVALMTGFSQSL